MRVKGMVENFRAFLCISAAVLGNSVKLKIKKPTKRIVKNILKRFEKSRQRVKVGLHYINEHVLTDS